MPPQNLLRVQNLLTPFVLLDLQFFTFI